MTRPAAVVLAFAISLLAIPAVAQTEEVGQMRLYIQQLEERVRQLTGENERLTYEVNQLRQAQGLPVAGADQTGAVPVQPGALPGQIAPGQARPGAPPQDIGQLSVDPNDPRIAPDGGTYQPGAGQPGAPVDLSTLPGADGLLDPSGQPVQTAGMPQSPPVSAMTGSPRDEYDLAYGYILTGDYGLAESSFNAWLAAFPSDPQATDAKFWLGESHLQQGEYRDAANYFLAVYKAAPDSPKGPDALLKLGISLSSLGEKPAACATLAEVGKRYPQAQDSIATRVRDEQSRAGCS